MTLSHKGKGIDIVVLDMPLLDTRRGKDLLEPSSVTFAASTVFLWQRTSAPTSGSGRLRVLLRPKPKGIRFGRSPKPVARNFHSVYQRWKMGKSPGQQQQRNVGCPLTTFRYRAEIYEKSSCCRWSPLQEYYTFGRLFKSPKFFYSASVNSLEDVLDFSRCTDV